MGRFLRQAQLTRQQQAVFADHPLAFFQAGANEHAQGAFVCNRHVARLEQYETAEKRVRQIADAITADPLLDEDELV